MHSRDWCGRMDAVWAPPRCPWPGWCSHSPVAVCWLFVAHSCFFLQWTILGPYKSHQTEKVPERLLPPRETPLPWMGAVFHKQLWSVQLSYLVVRCSKLLLGRGWSWASAETTSLLGFFPALPYFPHSPTSSSQGHHLNVVISTKIPVSASTEREQNPRHRQHAMQHAHFHGTTTIIDFMYILKSMHI